ncbi:MAG: methionine synthase [Treponema sp.]|jgi:5-methyltetrahydrofolate--homocysteine methyltransferase|nr:methionine synthase [Treponema sp.]
MTARKRLNAIAKERILILDGAMGSLIQALKFGEADFRGTRFADHKTPLSGCNDILCLTKPEAISAIHEAYLAAGADIIETCSFNSTAVSLADYGLADMAYENSVAAAALARVVADLFSTPQKPRFVAGSMGPTAKSASLSPDVNDPAKRGIYWDELEAAYYDSARGLLDGGADILLLETIFDTLNAKSALFAISRLLKERKLDTPVMISATISGESGRLLSGQTIEAFCASVLHAEPWAIGLNCSFGAENLLSHIRALSAAMHNMAAPCLLSAHPNAGLPNDLGSYDESPETMAACIEQYLKEGLLNIAGGCCGSTPAHIAAIAEKAAQYQPRIPCTQVHKGRNAHIASLAGLELLNLAKPGNEFQLTLIGERTNVAGSKKFLRLISETRYSEALAIARNMIEDGAAIICVGMDDAMLDAEKTMAVFLDRGLSDPDIAKVPVMIDSSRWNVIEAGLKRLQGKGVVNSINLKDGEGEFQRRAELVRRYGAAAVVMLIDEQGQAVSFERKIEIAGRAYRLLTATGFPPENIVFDPNVLAVATGISEHDPCALDFIRACAWIRDNCPGVQISGGISNLSFSFRGNNAVREAMHSVFLKHASESGLTMAIVNPSTLVAYNAIEEKLRNAAEDVILNRRPDAAERLLEIAEQTTVSAANSQQPAFPSPAPHSSLWRDQSLEERIIHAMLKGLDDYIEKDTLELRESGWQPLKIVEGPLMTGMKEVGKRFGEGKMYLPQVLRSARVMKKAVAALEPFMEQRKSSSAPKIVLATVKGDVHDIGKNIVAVVLASSGFQIIDLGVMVPAEQILEAAEKEGAAAIGLSGLISPSLEEMIRIAREMEQRRMKIPLLIGGAAASLVHTALRIAPAYSGPVVYVSDAGKASETVRALLSASDSPCFLQDLAGLYREAVQQHEAIQSRLELLPLETARANRPPLGSYKPTKPKTSSLIELNDYPLEKVIPYIDWNAFLHRWETPDTEKIQHDAQALLEKVKAEGSLKLRGVVGIFPAAAEGDDVVIGGRRFCFLRSQAKKPARVFNPCLADFLVPAGADSSADWLGLFALSAGFGLPEAASEYQRNNDEYGALLLASLANALTEAFVEEVHLRIRREWWGYAPEENLSVDEILKGKYAGIRPAFGYPACPDHEDKRIAFDLLEANKRCGLELTETAMIIPAASVCGMFMANPAAYYFGVGATGEDQRADWSARKSKHIIK